MQSHAPILEAFCNGAKAEVGLINAVQVYCYTDTRIIKAFPQLVKIFYNADVVSDQAIIYWYQKGAKPQGKQHFLKATEPLVKVSTSSRICFEVLMWSSSWKKRKIKRKSSGFSLSIRAP